MRVVGNGRTCRLNSTGAVVMDACDGGTPGDAVERLAARHPAIARTTLENDVLASVRSLLDRNVLVPAL